MNEPERRKVSLAGLGLIGAGAVLGLALTAPGATGEESAALPPTATAPADPPPAAPADPSPAAPADPPPAALADPPSVGD